MTDTAATRHTNSASTRGAGATTPPSSNLPSPDANGSGSAPRPAETTTAAPPWNTALNLWQRLALVEGEAEDIAKSGQAPPEMGGFLFAEAGDAFEMARKLYSRHGIACIRSLADHSTEVIGETRGEKPKPIYRSLVEITLTLINADVPEEREVIRWPGMADDTMDKSLAKAGTAARKYGTLAALGITGDSPDADGEHPAAGSGSRTRASQPVNPEDDFGACDEPGCPGRWIRKQIKAKSGKEYTVIECSNRRWKGQGTCDRETDFRPDWKRYNEHRQRTAGLQPGEKPVPQSADVPRDTSSADEARSVAILLSELDGPSRMELLERYGYDKGDVTTWLRSLVPDDLGSVKASAELAKGAKAGDIDPDEIPF